jgi:hypothetical protein
VDNLFQQFAGFLSLPAEGRERARRKDCDGSLKVCLSRTDGSEGRRQQGGTKWYEVGTYDHAFVETIVEYRWHGDDLRRLVRADLDSGNDQLKRRYNWVRDHYYHGVEFNGSFSSHGDVGAATYGAPLQ